MIVTVMYQLGESGKFDMDYYLQSHMPLVHRLWGPAGLVGAQVLRGTGSPTGEPPAFAVITLLEFASLAAFKAAAKAHGREVMGDIARFTDATVLTQFNERPA
jgi:uncharacterized protein (TIGR02118 family)